MLDDKAMTSLIAQLEAHPGVLATALIDSAGTDIARAVAPAHRQTIDHAVARLLPVLDELCRTEPTWTSAFLEIGNDHIVGRRLAEVVVLVVTQTPLPLAELDRIIASALEDTLTSLRLRPETSDPRTITMQLSEEDVVWVTDGAEDSTEDSGDMFEAALHSARAAQHRSDRAASELLTPPSALAALPQPVPPESDRTDRLDARAAERLPRELAAMTNIIERQDYLERHLDMARWVQSCILPERNHIAHSFVDIAGHFCPADTCSGDWWAVDPLPDGRLVLVIGDVTGHGVGPAMVTAIARGAYDVLRAHLGVQVTCEALLQGINTAVYRAAHRSLLMTCAVCIFDPRSRTMSFANAGHTFPLLGRHWNGSLHIREIVNRGSPLGTATTLDLSTMLVALEPDDFIFWYTDGLIDCENEQGEQFGRKHLLRALRRLTVREPAVICDTIRHILTCFCGSRPQSDDVAFAAARIK